MSTKIYNGYIFTEKDFFTLNKKLQDLAVQMKKVKTSYVAKAVAEIYASYVDQKVLFGRTPEELENFTGDSVLDFLTALERKAKESHLSPYRSEGQWDLECSVTLYPLKSGKIICQFFEQGVVKGYKQLWTRQKYVKDYHYQNSSDRPSKISAKVWREREKMWNEALSKSSRPLDSGPSFVLVTADLPIYEVYSGPNAFSKHFPTKAERIDKAFKDYARHVFFLQPEAKGMLNDTSKWMEAFRQCADYCKTHEAKLKADFDKLYGSKFLDLAEVLKTGLAGLTKGQLD